MKKVLAYKFLNHWSQYNYRYIQMPSWDCNNYKEYKVHLKKKMNYLSHEWKKKKKKNRKKKKKTHTHTHTQKKTHTKKKNKQKKFSILQSERGKFSTNIIRITMTSWVSLRYFLFHRHSLWSSMSGVTRVSYGNISDVIIWWRPWLRRHGLKGVRARELISFITDLQTVNYYSTILKQNHTM